MRISCPVKGKATFVETSINTCINGAVSKNYNKIISIIKLKGQMYHSTTNVFSLVLTVTSATSTNNQPYVS